MWHVVGPSAPVAEPGDVLPAGYAYRQGSQLHATVPARALVEHEITMLNKYFTDLAIL